MAAKLKFTPELGEEICRLVQNGLPIAVAAQAVGVGRSTLYDWRERDGEDFERFRVELDKAAALCEQKITFNIVRASRKDWKAGAFWLKCRHPELYGAKIEISQQLQRGVQELLDDVRIHMSAEAYRELLYAIAKVMGVAGLAEGADGTEGRGGH